MEVGVCCSELVGVAGMLLLYPSGQGTALAHSNMLHYTALCCTALHTAALHCTYIVPNCKMRLVSLGLHWGTVCGMGS